MAKEDTQAARASIIDWAGIRCSIEETQRKIEHLVMSDPELEAKILRERAAEMAQRPVSDSPARLDAAEVLEFLLAGERYALETRYVAKVLPMAPITRIPGTPDFVVGVIPAEGEVLSVIDLRTLLDLPLSRISDPASIIVIANDEMEFGILADEIAGVERYPFASLEDPAAAIGNKDRTYLIGISRNRTGVLNAVQLLSDAKLAVDLK
ncbi:MAG TPA: chemotaxis protein CheW [Paucimonas sp.]|nr:chemotaxis protein CheW [Paucimonas sp.]